MRNKAFDTYIVCTTQDIILCSCELFAEVDFTYPYMYSQSIAEKLRAEHAQRQKTSAAVGFSRQNSTSSVQSVTSIEVAEITETARNAEAQIAELASHSTDDDNARCASSPQPGNHNDTEHHGIVSTPDGSIRPVAPFITIPHGQTLRR